MAAHKIPTATKELTGTAQPCRINNYEPTLPKGTPNVPKTLSKLGRRKWEKLIRSLQEQKTLTKVDTYAVEQCAHAQADFEEACIALKAYGKSYYEVNGQIKPHPAFIEKAKADARIYQWLAKLGLTPADRNRVAQSKESEPTFDMDFLND